MRTRTGRLVIILAAAFVLLPNSVWGQEGTYVPPPLVNFPIPTGGERYRHGTGMFFAFDFLYMRQTNPLRNQQVAVRGFVDIQGGITGNAGTFVGTGTEALNVADASGPVPRQPGLAMVAGWRFMDGTTVEVGWWHLTDARYSASANPIAPGFLLGPGLADTFITAPVTNFPPAFAGPLQNVIAGNPGDTFGIWNAASEMQVDFVQRFDQGYLNLRTTIDEDRNTYRIYGLVGARAIIMWERFKWRTVARGISGQAGPLDVANYTNVVSNRLYGATIGCGYDWFIGDSPLGGFAITAEIQGSLMVDIVKERAKYELGDLSTAPSRAMNEYTVAPMVQGDVSVWWYPYEGIQARLGWNAMAIFNTISSPEPIDFNVGRITPEYHRLTTRIIRGLHAGVGFVF